MLKTKNSSSRHFLNKTSPLFTRWRKIHMGRRMQELDEPTVTQKYKGAPRKYGVDTRLIVLSTLRTKILPVIFPGPKPNAFRNQTTKNCSKLCRFQVQQQFISKNHCKPKFIFSSNCSCSFTQGENDMCIDIQCSTFMYNIADLPDIEDELVLCFLVKKQPK